MKYNKVGLYGQHKVCRHCTRQSGGSWLNASYQRQSKRGMELSCHHAIATLRAGCVETRLSSGKGGFTE
ncbi:MAG: hypothetical protein F6K58_31430 [Symploca sp. SIO2E9]|nr:hypothetical protein [Symploca sp. SIO2E9]